MLFLNRPLAYNDTASKKDKTKLNIENLLFIFISWKPGHLNILRFLGVGMSPHREDDNVEDFSMAECVGPTIPEHGELLAISMPPHRRLIRSLFVRIYALMTSRPMKIAAEPGHFAKHRRSFYSRRPTLLHFPTFCIVIVSASLISSATAGIAQMRGSVIELVSHS